MSTITGADMEQAATSLAAPDATAAASTPAPSETSSAAPTTSASVLSADELNDPSWGDIPQSARGRIAQNYRARLDKEAAQRIDTARQEWERQHWANGIDPQEAAVIRDWHRRGATDPAGLVADLFARVQSDPTHGPRLRSEAARMLRQGQQADDPEPPPDIPTDRSNGRPVVYSAQQQAKREAWLKRQWMAEVNQQLAPFQQDLQTRQQQDGIRQLQAQSDAYAATTVQQVIDLPGFKDQKAAIAKEYASMGIADPRTGQIVPDPNDPRSEGEKLRDAYLKVVVPTLGQTTRQQVVADLHRKAHASTINPAQTTGGEPFDHRKDQSVRGWENSLRYEWERRQGR